MTKFAIDDRLDDVDIHLGGRFDPRHLGSYLCPMEELSVFDRTGSCGKPLGLIVGRRAVEADEVPSVLPPSATDLTPPLHPCQNRLQHPRNTPPSLHGRPLPASRMDARRVKTRDAGLQLRRQPGSGGRRPTPRKTVKLAAPFDDAGMSDSDHPANRLTSMPPVET